MHAGVLKELGIKPRTIPVNNSKLSLLIKNDITRCQIVMRKDKRLV